LIPILSFILLKGKCRYCGGKVSLRYPAAELFTGIVFLFIYLKVGFERELVPYLFMCCVLIAAAFTDLESMIIHDSLILFALMGGILLNFLFGTAGLKEMLLGSVAGGLPLLAVALMSKGGMGGGDIKLASVMGIFLGWKLVLAALFISFFIGGMVGMLLLLLGIKRRKDCIPFGPFLALGGILSILFGRELIHFYTANFYV